MTSKDPCDHPCAECIDCVGQYHHCTVRRDDTDEVIPMANALAVIEADRIVREASRSS